MLRYPLSLLVVQVPTISGFVFVSFQCLLAVVPVRFSATSFWRLVCEYNVTWYSAVPTIHQILLILADKELEEKRKADASATLQFPKLRFIRSCSSPLAPYVFEKLERVFGAPVLEGTNLAVHWHYD